MLKKFLISLFCFFACSFAAYADDLSEVQTLFQNYIDGANSYSSKVVNFYLPDATIERVVIKPDGTKETVNFSMSRYKRELLIGQKTARLVRYKNTYTDKKYEKLDNGDYKISALRSPSKDTKKYAFYFIVTKTPDGTWKVKKESMETPVQKFLHK